MAKVRKKSTDETSCIEKKISIDVNIKMDSCEGCKNEPKRIGIGDWIMILLALMPVILEYERYIQLLLRLLTFLQNLLS